jgi:phosphoribosylanthranilate isomerase
MTVPEATRTRVKICGITNRQDALDAVECGADALGFNLYPGSKRYIDLAKEQSWIKELPPFVTKVAVMVNPTIAEAEAMFAQPFIDMVQFHGDEDEAFCARFASMPFIKAIRVGQGTALEDDVFTRFSTPCVLIDSLSPGEFGGTGKQIAGETLESFAPGRRSGGFLILSGGLKPSNVREAVQFVRPYAVDVASGVEGAPGRKDKALMRAFILAAQGNKI